MLFDKYIFLFVFSSASLCCASTFRRRKCRALRIKNTVELVR